MPIAGGLVVVPLVVAANVLAYLMTVLAGGMQMSPPTGVLVEFGALVPAAVDAGQYWRIAAAGFLHASPLHIAANMFALLMCGPALERRLGPTAFGLLYAVALVGGGVTSVLGHHGFFVGVGASGAVFGLFGALFALWVLGRIAVPARFFVINFGLNILATAGNPQIDWMAHLGGLAAGMVCVAVLALWAPLAAVLLRCRFPEFVSANAVVLVAAGGLDRMAHPAGFLDLDPTLLGAVSWVAGAMAFVKLLDVLLAVRRGLAIVVALLAACNALAAGLVAARLLPGWSGADVAAAVGTGGLTMLLCVRPLRRGLGDMGFVPASLLAADRRDWP